MTDPAHEVCVPCDCGDIEHCRMELYVSDVRLLERRLVLLFIAGLATGLVLIGVGIGLH